MNEKREEKYMRLANGLADSMFGIFSLLLLFLLLENLYKKAHLKHMNEFRKKNKQLKVGSRL